jgi:uncharacterized membrane protein
VNVTVLLAPPVRNAGLIDHVIDPAISGLIAALTTADVQIKTPNVVTTRPTIST